MFFIAYAFKGQVHVFAGQVKFVSHSSSRTSAILKFFCPLYSADADPGFLDRGFKYAKGGSIC